MVSEENEISNEKTSQVSHLKTITLEILSLIKDAQSQHGLKHGDYHRYRSYCSRRIHRLRKSLNFIHATGSKNRSVYLRKKLTNELVFPTTDESNIERKDPLRYLLIPLYQSERAWSYAMALKQEANTEPRKKFHLIRRLRKAVTHAIELEKLCNEPLCDARTKLESQAYASYLRGIYYFETERWIEASEYLKKADAIYLKLYQAIVNDCEYSNLYQQRIDELKPTLRYCAFNIDESGGGAKEFLDKIKQGDLLEDDLLSSKLDQLILQTREKQTVTFSEINWLGRVISIKQEKIRSFLLNYQEFQGIKSDSIKVSQIEKLLFECRDNVQMLRDSNQEKTPLYLYLQYLRLTLTIKRNLKLIDNTQNLIDLIRLYEIILTSLNEIKSLQLVLYFNDDETSLEKFQGNIDAEMLAYKAFRCYFISKLTKLKWQESVALLHRSSLYCNEYINKDNVDDQEMKDKIKHLLSKAEAEKYTIYANSLITDNSEIKSKDSKQEKAIIDRLDEYIEDDSKLLSGDAQFVNFPPSFRPIPCKPLFFDLALNHIQFPTLETEIASPKASGITGLVKGWLSGGWRK